MRFLQSIGWALLIVSLGSPSYLPAAEKSEKKGGKKAAPKEEAAGGEEGAEAKKEKKKKKSSEEADLTIQGILGAAAKGMPDLYEFTYLDTSGKKRAKKKVWLKIDPSSASLVADRVFPDMSAFKEGDSLKVFAKPFETEGQGPQGYTGKYRQLQAARIIIGGKKVEVNDEFKDAKDEKFKWCDVAITKPGPSPTVEFDAAEYRVNPDKGAAIVKREDADPKKDVKKGAMIWVKASSGDERPAVDKENRPSFKAIEVIVLNPRCNWYSAILPSA